MAAIDLSKCSDYVTVDYAASDDMTAVVYVTTTATTIRGDLVRFRRSVGATADNLARFGRATAAVESAERTAARLDGWRRLMRSLGAVVGTGVKYWPARDPAGVCGPQRPPGRPLVIRAGFMSQHRGLSWSRRSRKGLK
jgi:hypothetical protein